MRAAANGTTLRTKTGECIMNVQATMEKLKNYGADVQGALTRFVDDAEFYCMCLSEFMTDRNVEILGQAVRARDYAQAFDVAHTLKGVAGNIGLTPLYISICALVESLRAQEYGNLDMEYEAVSRRYTELKTLFEGMHDGEKERLG